MITRENFKQLLSTIDGAVIENVMDDNKEFILMESHYFFDYKDNVGGYATIESVDFDEELQNDAEANGNLLCDKETFLMLLEQ